MGTGDQQLGSGPGPEGGGQQINISTGKRLGRKFHPGISKRPARLKCGIQQTTDSLKTTVGEFCRGVLSTSRKILWNISIVDSQCRRRLRILDAGEEEAVPEDAAVMGDWRWVRVQDLHDCKCWVPPIHVLVGQTVDDKMKMIRVSKKKMGL